MAFKFVIGHHLKTLLNDVEEKQKKDISDFTKGHLNETRLLQAPLLANRKSWASSRVIQQNAKSKTKNKSRLTGVTGLPKEKTTSEVDALLDFTVGTSGVIPPLSKYKFSNNQDVRYRLIPVLDDNLNELKEIRSKSPQSLYSQLDDGTLIEELPLQEIQIPTSQALKLNSIKSKKTEMSPKEDSLSDTDAFSHSVVEMYNRGITKTDQYKKLKAFETVVLKKKDMSEKKILSGERASRHHEKKLEKELAALSSVDSSHNLLKLQVYSSVFEDIINESPTFNKVLHSIKEKYDSYIATLLNSQSLQDDMLRDQIFNMTASGVSQPGEMFFASEYLTALEEKTRNLLKLNQRLHEEVKSQQRYLNTTPEVPARKPQSLQVKRTPPVGYSRKELPIELSFELENMKALILEKQDELNALYVQTRDDFVPVSVCTHLEQCIKETEGEVQKLLKQNEYFERSIAEMETELKDAIVEADTSEKDARRIWHRVNSVRDMFGSQQSKEKNEEDFDEESKWNWYIS
ncbi:hypothetical protein BgiMline_015230 [Biomphalaria glabrata]|uniref:Translin-associated factor X-interacting protein 1 N-terminal domain-containing protein n=1 Tax=Biomphalaria glabrata TaxID=6526 RepID=A0A2C9KDP7_BIOGL|nr:hypothetical protein BgiMline_022336 [Biomphalaria glabrata]